MSKLACSICLRETNHEELFKTESTTDNRMLSPDPEVWYSEGYNYALFKCLGCSNVVMRKDFWSSDLTPDMWDPSYRSWYPALVSRQAPPWLKRRNDLSANVLKQVYVALNANLVSLAMMGIRTVLDQYLVEKVRDIGGFEKKLKKAAELGFLSAKQVELIAPALEAGHAASHRAYEPTVEALSYSLEVVENLLHQDELARNSKGVADAIPRR